ncbi:hypothetical protein POTOM_007795 [Populus tomentosa]|uniref:Uncharacterized protein n=1 Tax=Populus tomentosa TaxID=118781 RepID=A0A8X8DBV9_POPTO|nr:hypothetical protein POTOM_007795 [Populus tomentosa]
MPSHVTTPSSNSDSSFQENQPLERRERVRGVLFLFNKGSRSPSTKGFEGPTPIAVILEAAFYWKRMKISIPLNSKVEIIPLPHSCLAPTSPIYICLRSSSQAPLASRVEDIFSNLMLDHAPICFPTLNEKEKRVMMIVIQGRFTFEPVREENVAQDIKMDSIITAYSKLQGKMEAQAHALESTE